MTTVCPRCATTHKQRTQCPGCGDRQQFADEHHPLADDGSLRWQHTPWGRILIGLLLAQGLFYGLRHFAIGLLLASRSPGEAPDESAVLYELILTQILQALTLLAGGMLAGSGQTHGAVLGSVVGVWNGVFASLALQRAGQPFSTVALYGEPLLQMALGALAGWLGCKIWKPLPSTEPRETRSAVRKAPTRTRQPLFAGKVALGRVVLGTTLAAIGSLSATALFNLLSQIGEGSSPGGSITTLDELVTWEIKALALIAGGALAGSNSFNGLKQGLCVGIATTFVLSALDPRAGRWLELTSLLLLTSVSLCLVGGWFGSQLLPPVVPYKRGGRLGEPSMS